VIEKDRLCYPRKFNLYFWHYCHLKANALPIGQQLLLGSNRIASLLFRIPAALHLSCNATAYFSTLFFVLSE
jgi:hypothetical protein